MKIALIVERFDPRGGGAERSTQDVARELTRRGHKVTIIAGRCPLGTTVPGVLLNCRASHTFHGALGLWQFHRWARRQVHAGHFEATISFATAVSGDIVEPWGGTVRETLDRNLALRRGQRARFWKRLRLSLSLKQRLLLHLERQTMRDPGVKVFVAISGYVARQLRFHYGLPDNRIRIIPNAVEMAPLSDADRALYRRRVRDGFSIPDTSIAYLFAAMNPRLKGCDALLRAGKVLAERGVDFTILLAGRTGYAQQHMTANLGIRDKVRFIGTTEHMAELYCAADVTVLPTFYDPSSRVVIESLLAGTPAISTTFNGASDFIRRRDGRWCGRVLENPADVSALANAMMELIDPDERQRCAAATAGLAPELSIARHVDGLEEALKAI